MFNFSPILGAKASFVSLLQQRRDVDPMLFWCWADLKDCEPTLKQHWDNISCLRGRHNRVERPHLAGQPYEWEKNMSQKNLFRNKSLCMKIDWNMRSVICRLERWPYFPPWGTCKVLRRLSNLSFYLSLLSRITLTSQQTRDIDQMLLLCWVSVVDGGPTLQQHLVNISCLLGLRLNTFITLISIIRPISLTTLLNQSRGTSTEW